MVQGTIGMGRTERNLWGSISPFAGPHITYADGSEEVIATDSSWRSAKGPITMSELYHGETYDARLELEGFSSGDFNSNDWHGVETIDHGFDMLKPQINEPVRAIQR